MPAAGPPDVGLAQPQLLAGLHPGVRAAGGEELGQLDLVPLPLAEAPGGLWERWKWWTVKWESM